MRNPREWLKELLEGRSLAGDGSEHLAREWMDLLDNQEELQSLLKNKAFQRVLLRMERDFTMRMHELVESDAELKAIKRVFIRTVGLKDAEERIHNQMVEYLHEDVDVT